MTRKPTAFAERQDTQRDDSCRYMVTCAQKAARRPPAGSSFPQYVLFLPLRQTYEYLKYPLGNCGTFWGSEDIHEVLGVSTLGHGPILVLRSVG